MSSYATTTSVDESVQSSTTFGDLSHNNLSIVGDYNLGDGLSEGTLQMVLNAVSSTQDKASTILKNAIDAVLGSSEKVSAAYGEAYNDTRSTVAAFKPVMMYGSIALVAFFLLKKGGKKLW